MQTVSGFDSSNIVIFGGKTIVVITINHTLGASGFFASEELYNENLKNYSMSSYNALNGTYDSINAIKWIKKYIPSFGGSAGGLSTCTLFLSPLLKII